MSPADNESKHIVLRASERARTNHVSHTEDFVSNIDGILTGEPEVVLKHQSRELGETIERLASNLGSVSGASQIEVVEVPTQAVHIEVGHNSLAVA